MATVVCDGTADQVEINNYLTPGNTVTLAPGNFWTNGWIYPKSGSRLTGQGNSSIINLSNSAVAIYNVNNVELDHFRLTGSAYRGGALVITAINSSISGFSIHDILSTAKGSNGFLVYPNSGKISNVSFVRDDANSPDGFGFQITGEGTTPTVEDVTFFKCSVENAGVAPTRLTTTDGSSWITGFDFAESPGLTVNRIQAINCSANGAWESDYHFEVSPTKTNITIMDSSASNAGLKTGGAMFGAGYLIAFANNKDDIVLSNNTASNNRVSSCSWGKIADLLLYVDTLDNYTVYTPPQNIIFPANSSKVASRISQANCTGLAVDNGPYKDLFLYSSDGNPVNQQIELGALYTANDGKTYTFSGTKIVAQFSDYAVIRLVKSSTTQTPTQAPAVVTNAASGITTTAATLNANLTSMGNTSSVVVSFEYGLTTGYGNIIAAVPQILTTTGAFTASATGLAPNTTYHYRAKAEYVNNGTSWGNDQTFTTTATTAPAVWDVNEDGAVNALDMISIGQHYGESGAPGWIRQDVNHDGTINVLDAILVGQHTS